MEAKQAKVFIVDDYPAMRESLRKLVDMESDFQVCGEASDLEQAYQGIVASDPDVAILDLVLGQESGVELLKRLKSRLRKLPVLVLTMLPETLNAETVLNHGALGYIMKSESPDQILAALRQVMNGQIYLSPAMELKLQKQGNSR